MGMMSSWAAIKSASKDAVLAHLGVYETAKRVEQGCRRWTRALSCLEFPGDWLVIYSEDFDWADAERLKDLSRFGPVVGLQFEDKVDYTSIATEFEAGVELWRIFHRSRRNKRCRFEVSGNPPDLARVKDGERETIRVKEPNLNPTDYCYYMATANVAKAACGYRDGDDDVRFFDLKPIDPAKAYRPSIGVRIMGHLFGWRLE